jgi:hypothetical protein
MDFMLKTGASKKWIFWMCACIGIGILFPPLTVWFLSSLLNAVPLELMVWAFIVAVPVMIDLAARWVKRRPELRGRFIQHLPKGILPALSFGGMWFVCCSVLAAQPTSSLLWGSVLLTIPFGVVCLICLIRIFTEWKVHRLRALVPFLICLVVLLSARRVGWIIGNELFERWRLPRYEVLIRKIQSGTIPVSTELTRIPMATNDLYIAYIMFAQRATNGALTVEFNYGGAGPPPMHSAYLYSDSGSIERGSRFDERWPYRRRISTQWFEVSD